MFWGYFSVSQTLITGKIADADTGNPLPFVNVIYNNNFGVSSNLDGFFKIETKENITKLLIKSLSFKDTLIFIKNKISDHFILLKKDDYYIDEVIIFPKENPADRIIKKVVKNRKFNNPEKNLNTFSYESYNKFIGNPDKKSINRIDSIFDEKRNIKKMKRNDSLLNAGKTKKYIAKIDSLDVIKIDSVRKARGYYSLKEFTDVQDLLINETVSKIKYKAFGKYIETIIASRTSGVKDPSFFLIATQFQSFTFYDDFISLGEKRYLNPISKGSTRKYLFVIEDTVYTSSGDTVFNISFRPRKNINFNGLKGVLNINTNKYAIQSVIAEPFKELNLIEVKIRQNYEFVDNKQWFPKELNTILFLRNEQLLGKNPKIFVNANFIYSGKTYLSDIKINPNFEKENFKSCDIEVRSDAGEKDSIFWNTHRRIKLTEKDKRTYHNIDSIGKAINLDFKLNILKSIISGYIPYKIFDIDIQKLFSYNNYEGFRLGFGFVTNTKLSKYLSLGGYAAYGFKDKQIKFGSEFNILPFGNKDFKINFTIQKDVFETGSLYFIDDKNIFFSETYRNQLINKMYNFEKIQLNFYSHQINSVKINLFARKSLINNKYFTVSDNTITNLSYNLSEAGLQMKISPNSKYQKYLDEKMIVIQKDPIFWLNLLKGFEEFDGKFNFMKITAKVSESFQTKILGRTNFQLKAGYISGDVPYLYLFNGYGSYEKLAVDTKNSFNTMRMNEFVSDKFVSLFFRQDFSSLIFKTKNYSPEISFITNIGWGGLSKEYNYYFSSGTLENVYSESGILIDHIISLRNVIGLGAGIYYRYGAYKLPNEIDNFAFKFSLAVRL